MTVKAEITVKVAFIGITCMLLVQNKRESIIFNIFFNVQ